MALKSFFTAAIICLMFIQSDILFAQDFTTDDKVYDRNIQTVLLYPNTGSVYDPLSPPIIPIEQPIPLQLEFDELGNNFKSYYAKLIYCNADWSVSSLSAVNYLDVYNEIFINDRKVSNGTRFSYIHYKFTLPRVLVSGNYVVKVYKDYDEDKVILTKRFSVYEKAVSISPTVKFSTDPSVRNTKQQVDFNVNYSDMEVINPVQNLKVILRQNFRWDNAITDLKPVIINEEVSNLEYFYFNQENNFYGGNEFRLVEFKSATFGGFNVMKVQRDSNKAEAFLYPDKNRGREAYSQPLIPDFDGRYYIQNYETGDKEFMADYMYVNFTLESPDAMNGNVYVFGGMTDWKLDRRFEMVYHSDTKKYTCQTLLKQGAYNYIYVLTNPSTQAIDETHFEGTFSTTQNNYDVMVYYRPFGTRTDRLIGYRNINFLSRR